MIQRLTTTALLVAVSGCAATPQASLPATPQASPQASLKVVTRPERPRAAPPQPALKKPFEPTPGRLLSDLSTAEMNEYVSYGERKCETGNTVACNLVVRLRVHGTGGIGEDKKRALAFAMMSCNFGDDEGCGFVHALVDASVRAPGHGITLTAFKLLIPGMSERLAQTIVGSDGTLSSETKMAGYHSLMRSWQNPDGSNAIITFQNGQLVSKAQSGLK